MTTDPESDTTSHLGGGVNDGGGVDVAMVDPVPAPGALTSGVLVAWELIDDGQEPYDPDLPRPWDPATCTDPAVRAELWDWLDRFVSWINQQCLWDPNDLIPPCWPHHPHLIHEIAVLAVQRHQASHTYTLPTFLTRTHTRLRRYCDTGHQPTPAAAAHTRHHSPAETRSRETHYKADAAQAADTTVRGLWEAHPTE